jgi:hypothetical protein
MAPFGHVAGNSLTEWQSGFHCGTITGDLRLGISERVFQLDFK